MNARTINNTVSRRLAVSINELPTMLGCGRKTAREIGKAAGAEFHIGSRVLFNVALIERYLEEKSKEV